MGIKCDAGCDSWPRAQPASQRLLRAAFILGSELESDQLSIWNETKAVQLRF